MPSSYVGENKEFERHFLSGGREVELTPQGTLAEKLRAGGSGIATFFTPTGVETQMAEDGLPVHDDGAGDLVLEESITTDFSLVHALKGDRHGNLVFNNATRNFPTLAATLATMAGKMVKGPGGAVDLVPGAGRLIILMDHVANEGTAEIVNECSLPLTGKRVANRIITDLAVIDVTDDGLVLRELAPGVTVDEVIAAAEPPSRSTCRPNSNPIRSLSLSKRPSDKLSDRIKRRSAPWSPPCSMASPSRSSVRHG